MIYGLYLSASGVMTNSHRLDVIANNLANSETVGFKRDLSTFKERRTALHERANAGDWSDPTLENIGGGILTSPTMMDSEQGDLESTGNPLDIGIQGNGFFTVGNGTKKFLTRDGAFMQNSKGDLVLSMEPSQHLLDDKGAPIRITTGAQASIGNDGQVLENGSAIAKITLTDVADESKFTKQGATLLSFPDAGQIRPATGVMRSQFQERSNVDPTTELAGLMDAQRQLEANANMIKYQDSTLQRLVTEVGKIA
ncbi:MAG TPA: flagellar hook-basal body protein [Tepidisphaeraceae bacterium]|jgi:flagellar basal body rod protein FlgG|nr:flagellar hook-basal body protein [Tepidisphaeraceae bacterium]